MLPAAITEQKERLCCWVKNKKNKNNYLNAKHLTIVHISLPLYSIFPKCGFFFLAFVLFQRFVESTFFCGMYKYIIFVSILLSYSLAILLLFFLPFPSCLSLFLNIYLVVFLPLKLISFFFFFWSTAYPSSDKPTHVTLPNLCAFICCFFSWVDRIR